MCQAVPRLCITTIDSSQLRKALKLVSTQYVLQISNTAFSQQISHEAPEMYFFDQRLPFWNLVHTVKPVKRGAYHFERNFGTTLGHPPNKEDFSHFT
jgi:hypothetical protein